MAVNKLTFKDYAKKYIFNEMIDGRYKPGCQLNESIIASELEISRAPVREALRELTSHGLVEYKPRIGHFVAVLSKQEVIDTYVARGVLEGVAVAQSLGKFTKEDLVALEMMPQEMEDLSRRGKLKELIKLGAQFHELLFQGCQNKPIVAFTKQLSLKSDLLFYEYIGTLYTPKEIRDRHTKIVECIKNGDAGQVEELIRAHYIESGEKIAALI